MSRRLQQRCQKFWIEGMAVGYAMNHDGDFYRMWNPETDRVMISRDAIWLKRTFFENLRPEVVEVGPSIEEEATLDIEDVTEDGTADGAADGTEVGTDEGTTVGAKDGTEEGAEEELHLTQEMKLKKKPCLLKLMASKCDVDEPLGLDEPHIVQPG